MRESWQRLKSHLSFYWPVLRMISGQPQYWPHLFYWRRPLLEREVPWVNFATKKWLDMNLRPDMSVFEYGSGGSTLYYAARVRELVSVEHDPAWQKLVAEKLRQRGRGNAVIYCCPPTSPAAPDDYLSTDENYRDQSFRDYVRKIEDYPDNYFDLVIVDGRARNSCLAQSIAKVKDGGYIMLDNSERPEYDAGRRQLAGFAELSFFGPGPLNNQPWEATIWKVKK